MKFEGKVIGGYSSPNATVYGGYYSLDGKIFIKIKVMAHISINFKKEK
jgi:hypothetical protein